MSISFKDKGRKTAAASNLRNVVEVLTAGYTPTPADSTDYCIYTTVGPWYAARTASSQTTTVGKTMTIGAQTCTAS